MWGALIMFGAMVSTFGFMAAKKKDKGEAAVVKAKAQAKVKATLKITDNKETKALQSRMIGVLKYQQTYAKDPEKKNKAERALQQYNNMKEGKKAAFAELFDKNGGLLSDMAWTHNFTEEQVEVQESKSQDVAGYFSAQHV
jgi:hypothetical protein